jgi:hypothetical protein
MRPAGLYVTRTTTFFFSLLKQVGVENFFTLEKILISSPARNQQGRFEIRSSILKIFCFTVLLVQHMRFETLSLKKRL